MFVNFLPPNTALRVWDAFFCEGHIVLFRVALAIMALLEADLLDAGDAVDCYDVMQKRARVLAEEEAGDMGDPDKFMTIVAATRCPDSLEALRAQVIADEQQKVGPLAQAFHVSRQRR